MGPVIIAVVITALVVAGALVALRSRSTPDPAAPPDDAPVGPPRLSDTPMTGLESALDAVTDRSGRPMRQALEDEGGAVDRFRVPDDTGPLLRRALDEYADDTAAHERPGRRPADP